MSATYSTPTLCESCGARPASRRLYLGRDVDPFAVCQPCDMRALEAERRPAVRYVQSGRSAHPTPEAVHVLLARRELLDTI